MSGSEDIAIKTKRNKKDAYVEYEMVNISSYNSKPSIVHHITRLNFRTFEWETTKYPELSKEYI